MIIKVIELNTNYKAESGDMWKDKNNVSYEFIKWIDNDMVEIKKVEDSFNFTKFEKLNRAVKEIKDLK